MSTFWNPASLTFPEINPMKAHKIKIEPSNITNFRRDQSELEAFAMFAIAVAGKKAAQTADKIHTFLGWSKTYETPFGFLSRLKKDEHMDVCLRHLKIGQYKRIHNAFLGIMNLDLSTCTFDDLIRVRGIGPKTANFFLLHSREGYSGAVLDTHILRWMREVHGVPTPKSTPQGKSYLKYAALAENLIRSSYPDKSLADADLIIWRKMSENN
jgi:thermostable 8-oxoguanine DNA glycosylase